MKPATVDHDAAISAKVAAAFAAAEQLRSRADRLRSPFLRPLLASEIRELEQLLDHAASLLNYAGGYIGAQLASARGLE